MKIPENRRAGRARHDSVLELYDEGGRLITGIGRLVDFSTSGVRFSSTKSLKAGDALRARLRLLREGILDITAHVIWAKKKPVGWQYGIAFDSIQHLSKPD